MFVFFFLVFFEGKLLWNVGIIIVINNYRNVEWFIFYLWKFFFFSSCPSWRWTWHLSFTVHVSVLSLHDLSKILEYLLLMTLASTFSPLGYIPFSPTGLRRSVVPGSLSPYSSTRGNTLLPVLSHETQAQVWGQNLWLKTVNLYFLHRHSRNLDYLLHQSYCLISKCLCMVIRTSVIKQETKE